MLDDALAEAVKRGGLWDETRLAEPSWISQWITLVVLAHLRVVQGGEAALQRCQVFDVLGDSVLVWPPVFSEFL